MWWCLKGPVCKQIYVTLTLTVILKYFVFNSFTFNFGEIPQIFNCWTRNTFSDKSSLKMQLNRTEDMNTEHRTASTITKLQHHLQLCVDYCTVNKYISKGICESSSKSIMRLAKVQKIVVIHLWNLCFKFKPKTLLKQLCILLEWFFSCMCP